jgi:hypothetical protein
MAHDVFISYSTKDKLVADSVCVNLEAAGVRCWIAPRDIAPGEDWPTAITKAISQSRVMVLIFSADSNSSEDVGRELYLAANSKLVIIPFKIENIEPEPGKQYYLARTHWLDAINPPTQEQIHELLDCVKVLIPVRKTPQVFKVQPTTDSHIDQPIPGNELLPAYKNAARIPEPKAQPPAPASSIATPGAAGVSTASAFQPEEIKKLKKSDKHIPTWLPWANNAKRPMWIFFLIIVVALIALTCGYFGLTKVTSLGQIFRPTITPATTFTPTATMKPVATSTPTVANPPTQGTSFSHVYISDAFNDNFNEWLVGNVNGASWTGTRLIENGVLDWEGISREEMLSHQFPKKADLQEEFSDVQVSSRVKLLYPTMNGFYGVTIRGTDENNLMSFYAFVVDNTGKYAFLLYTDSKWINLIDWKENLNIKNGDWNKMTIQAIGHHFSLFMNDNLLFEIDDGTLPSGQGGIIVDLFTGGELIQIQFDDFEVRLTSP